MFLIYLTYILTYNKDHLLYFSTFCVFVCAAMIFFRKNTFFDSLCCPKHLDFEVRVLLIVEAPWTKVKNLSCLKIR